MSQPLPKTELSSLTLPQCALVTGAQGGIGKAILKKLSSYGVKIIALDINLSDLDFDENQVIEQIQCDLTDIKQISQVWSRLLEQGTRVDCLINNAGIYPAIGLGRLHDRTGAQGHKHESHWDIYDESIFREANKPWG